MCCQAKRQRRLAAALASQQHSQQQQQHYTPPHQSFQHPETLPPSYTATTSDDVYAVPQVYNNSCHGSHERRRKRCARSGSRGPGLFALLSTMFLRRVEAKREKREREQGQGHGMGYDGGAWGWEGGAEKDMELGKAGM